MAPIHVRHCTWAHSDDGNIPIDQSLTSMFIACALHTSVSTCVSTAGLDYF
jgi:hypothetical protein